jgi:hypothetical protein
MIEIKNDDYILGIWYARRLKMGKVYMWALRGKDNHEWTGHLRYRYDNLNLALSVDDTNPQNTFMHSATCENDMKKLCQDRYDELTILFCHESDFLIVGGNLNKLHKIRKDKTWLPLIRDEDYKNKTKKYNKKKK